MRRTFLLWTGVTLVTTVTVPANSTAQTVRASIATGGTQATGGDAVSPSLGANGRYVVFHSASPNLVSGDTNGKTDVFIHDTVTRATTRVSLGTGGAEGDGDSVDPVVTPDGRYIAFSSSASNLTAGDTNGIADVFVRDRSTGVTTRVSVATGGAQATGPAGSGDPAITPDGRFVVFDSFATNLVAGDTNGLRDIFLHDRATGATSRINLAGGGAQATGGSSYQAAISADARVVAFASDAANLVANDTNARTDAFVRDRTAGTTTRISVRSGGIQVSATGYVGLSPAISADGRYIAFQSVGRLVDTDTDDLVDAYRHDRQTDSTIRVSLTSGGAPPVGGGSGLTSISADGSRVAFSSSATNLVPDDTNGVQDIFIRDVPAGTTTRLTVNDDGIEAAGGHSLAPSLSADGRFVAFTSSATNLVYGDTNAQVDVFVRDNRKYQRRRVSMTSQGEQIAIATNFGALSGDGRHVVFLSSSPAIVPDDTNNRSDLFRFDRITGEVRRVSVGTGGLQATENSDFPSVSRDGRFIAFNSAAPNLVAGDRNGESDVFVHDADTGETTRVSLRSDGGEANGASRRASISRDGRYVAFISTASNLVTGDANLSLDVFVHDRVTRETLLVSRPTGNGPANGTSDAPSISGDGRYIVFESLASNLVPGDTNQIRDVFLFDRIERTTVRVSVSDTGQQTSAGAFGGVITPDGRFVLFMSSLPEYAPVNAHLQAYRYDRFTGRSTRVSLASAGAPANQATFKALFTADGSTIAFVSAGTNLAPGDGNNHSDVFVRDDIARTTRRVNLTPIGGQSSGSVDLQAISDDGRVILFSSTASDLAAGDTNGLNDLFVRVDTPLITNLSPRSGPSTGGTTVHVAGRGLVAGTTVSIGTANASAVDASDRFLLRAVTPPGVPGLANVFFTVPGFPSEAMYFGFTFVDTGAGSLDSDGDGTNDGGEALFSLDLLDPADALADPDGDHRSNKTELDEGTHPQSAYTSYLAEGATGGFLSTELELTNPTDGMATVLLRYLRGDGTTVPQVVKVGPHSRRTIDVAGVPGMEDAEFATIMESDTQVVLDRTMRWDRGHYGSHSETARSELGTTWYLAEGATHSGFQLFYLLQNPQAETVTTTVTFLRPAPLTPIVQKYSLGPHSRFTLWVNQADPGLAATDVSAQIDSTKPILVERAMYLDGARTFNAGHESAGVRFAESEWFLAEGATGPFFDLFVLIANPSPAPAQVRATFLKPDGTTIVKNYVIAPKSRFNIWVDYEDPALADTAVSTTISVTNAVGIIVERSMWWPGTAASWTESHNSPGATDTSTLWASGGGEDGGPNNAETYLLIANTAAYDAEVRVRLLFEDGTTAERTFTVARHSRFNVAVRAEFPEATGRRFGAVLESVGLGAAQIVVETSVYSDAGGAFWAAGTNNLAARLR